ncbi:FeoC-like transcriptional regulator [Spirochaeta lutea]|uniref:Transcriptional regulator HTH-type FeoC domain-containing protein n=1 Tax=Spirochaeta lutea TaxID=1480694 RepID=A0A098QUN9_9SPIO|nr:FeoC-like transcriptional regulator [Spirochaeta lutea]KGE71409.1 hypothetical protein DC28_11475 [Spirochaeta lutea]
MSTRVPPLPQGPDPQSRPLAVIRAYLTRHGEACFRQIMVDCGLSRALAQAGLDQLIRMGRVEGVTGLPDNSQGCHAGCCSSTPTSRQTPFSREAGVVYRVIRSRDYSCS